LQKFILLLLFLSITLRQSAQVMDTIESSEKKRLDVFLFTGGVLYAGSMTGLYYLWYKDYPQSNFHFFNDNHEWLQMDKLGHATTAYQIGRIGYDAMSFNGFDENHAVWIGGSMGFAYLSAVEILDGFSAEWGASTGDLIANTGGTALFISQQLLWDEQRISLKYSFHTTQYPAFRADLLGKNKLEQSLKDYNGQTYWASINIKAFLSQESRFPSWLNIAIGHSADGMTGASSNPAAIDGVPLPHFDRHRQWLVSADIDLSKINTRNSTLNYILKTLNFIKIPFPAIEFNRQDGLRFHPLYF
jgi:hypothetical protein